MNNMDKNLYIYEVTIEFSGICTIDVKNMFIYILVYFMCYIIRSQGFIFGICVLEIDKQVSQVVIVLQ